MVARGGFPSLLNTRQAPFPRHRGKLLEVEVKVAAVAPPRRRNLFHQPMVEELRSLVESPELLELCTPARSRL
jgi:hypothetical protein